MSQRVRPTLTAFIAAGAIAASPPAAFGQSPANSPEPIAGEPSCSGLIVASSNQDSGADGPSGNPKASAGPGFSWDPIRTTQS